MTDLSTWANIAEIAGLAALVGGAGFAWYQIRDARKARQDASSLEVLMTFLRDERFFLAVNHIMTLPDGFEVDAEAADARTEEDVETIYQTLEMLGYFVYARQVRLEDVIQLAGGGITAVWEKLRHYAEDQRKVRGDHAFEWMEWLCDRLSEAGIDPAPASKKFADWTP